MLDPPDGPNLVDRLRAFEVTDPLVTFHRSG